MANGVKRDTLASVEVRSGWNSGLYIIVGPGVWQFLDDNGNPVESQNNRLDIIIEIAPEEGVQPKFASDSPVILTIEKVGAESQLDGPIRGVTRSFEHIRRVTVMNTEQGDKDFSMMKVWWRYN